MNVSQKHVRSCSDYRETVHRGVEQSVVKEGFDKQVTRMEQEGFPGKVTIFVRNVIEVFWKQVINASMQDEVIFHPEKEGKGGP